MTEPSQGDAVPWARPDGSPPEPLAPTAGAEVEPVPPSGDRVAPSDPASDPDTDRPDAQASAPHTRSGPTGATAAADTTSPASSGSPPTSYAATPRRHTHPLTPLVSSVRTLGVLVAAVAVFGNDQIFAIAGELGGLLAVFFVLGGLIVLLALAVALNYVAWTRTEYFFDESGDFRLDSGVLQRNERRLTLSRLQSADINRPLLGRVVGLSQVQIEVAGGGDSRVVLSYLTDAEAHALRAEIVARAAGLTPDAGEAPEAVLATVPAGDLVLSLVMRSETLMLLAITVILVVGVTTVEGPGGLLLILVTGGLPLISVFGQFGRYFGFTVADSPDGLRLRHGLLNSTSQTVPPGRVQAIEISEPLLWRGKGWVRVSLNVAGQQSDGDGQQEHVLLPVAPHDVAARIINRVLPGANPASAQLLPAPARARWRAWLQFSNLGVGHNNDVMVTSRGFLTRRVAVIPHARTQSVEVSQGPWQRRLGLASVRVDSTPGPVTVVAEHREAGQARQIAEAQLDRAAGARATGRAARWMTEQLRTGPAVPPTSSSAEGLVPPAAPHAPNTSRSPGEAAPLPGVDAGADDTRS